MLGAFASRFAASSDLFGDGHRRPWSSVNFVTAHDGFTLDDLVSYNDKHNEANGEDNRDGHDDNRSWNCGVEGETDDPEILALRRQQKRNILATLLLSQGVPMLLGRRRARQLAGRQQQRLLPGQRDQLGRLASPGPRAGRLRLEDDRAAQGPQRAVAAGIPDRRPQRARAARRPVVRRRRQADDAEGMDDAACQMPRGAAGAGAAERALGPRHAQRLASRRRSSACPRDGARSWVAVVDTAGTHEGQTLEPGTPVTIGARSLVVWDSKLDA